MSFSILSRSLHPRFSRYPPPRSIAVRNYVSTSRTLAFKYPAWATSVGLTAVLLWYLVRPDEYRGAPTLDERPLAATHFTKTTLTSTESCGPELKLMELTVPPHLVPSKNTLGAIWSVFIKDDDIQVERAYTPLYGIDENGCMLFWIKKYKNGEVGRWLHSKSVGDGVELRGPLQTWAWKGDAWDEVVMISGGTGFTPFCQFFHNVIINSNSNTKFTLVHSSPSPAELPPACLLKPMQDYAARDHSRFRIFLHVDRSEEPHSLWNLKVGRVGKEAVEDALNWNQHSPSWWRSLFGGKVYNDYRNRKVLILICGPSPMITSIAGPYGRNFSQGAIGGVLQQLGFNSQNVWKL